MMMIPSLIGCEHLAENDATHVSWSVLSVLSGQSQSLMSRHQHKVSALTNANGIAIVKAPRWIAGKDKGQSRRVLPLATHAHPPEWTHMLFARVVYSRGFTHRLATVSFEPLLARPPPTCPAALLLRLMPICTPRVQRAVEVLVARPRPRADFRFT